MAEIFIKLLNTSIAASWLIIAVVLVRVTFRKNPKWINCILWALVGIRLFCPFSIQSAFSLIPSNEIISPEVVHYEQIPAISSGVGRIDNVVNPILEQKFEVSPEASVNQLYVWSTFAGIVWMVGVWMLAMYALISYFLLKRRVRESIHLNDKVYICDRIQNPFILGILKPHIYLPSQINDMQTKSIIAHEQAHICRLDHWWKPLGYLLLIVYWFNPLCWLAYVLFCRDIEMACDEKVIRDMDVEAKKEYAMVLLSCNMPRKMIAACSLDFGVVGVKERVKGVLSYKKPTLWIMIVAPITCFIVAVCFLTNPQNNRETYIKEGVYSAESAGDFIQPTILFQVSNKTFAFSYDTLSSYLSYGSYEVQDGKVICKTSDGLYKYIFAIIDNDTISFAQRGSSPIKMITGSVSVSDGTIFGYVDQSNEEDVIESNTNQTTGTVEVKVPTLDLTASTGADGSRLYYADQEKFIFSGYYGLFVYDMTNREIVRSVDLKSIGCDATQGESVCEITVAEDGMTVFLHRMDQSQMYVYKVADNSMTMDDYNLVGVSLYHNLYDGLEYEKYASYESDGETRYVVLVNDTTIGELGYTPDERLSSYNIIFGDMETTEDDYFEIMNRVLSEVGFENAYNWNNTVEFKEDADVLIKMATDSTGEYEVYGIISAKLRSYGMILNNIIDGNDNWNYVYEPWEYTGAPNDEPVLWWTADGKLMFSYVYANESGSSLWNHCIVDCGYETGHMELVYVEE